MVLFISIVSVMFMVSNLTSAEKNILKYDKNMIGVVDYIYSSSSFNVRKIINDENFYGDENLVYIYLVNKKYYERYVVNYNILSDKIIDLQLHNKYEKVYFLFPEYENLKGVTICDDINIIENNTFTIKNNTEGLQYKLFELNDYDEQFGEFKFSVFDELEKENIVEDSITLGEYKFTFTRDNIK